MALLFTNRTTNGTSAATHWHGGEGTFFAHGTFDGGTVVLEASFDNGTNWIIVGPDATFTAPGAGNFRIGLCKLRVSLSGATSPDVTAGI
ncbi:hypothetical protein [Pyruvatibacter sp.]|uniref:hypothetical protein n=1 Tax=Pyruvatibacter sp. TaxID=1981328 RepID=UPI0032EAF322